MRFLILNVSRDCGDQRCAHAEGRVSFSPRESPALFVCPSREIRFDGEHRLGDRQRRRDLNQKMDVILRPAHGMNMDSVVLANAGGVGPHSRLKIFRDEFAAVLRAEDHVEHVLSVRVRQLSHLRRSTQFYITHPGLPAWANFCRAAGAQGILVVRFSNLHRTVLLRPAFPRAKVARGKFSDGAREQVCLGANSTFPKMALGGGEEKANRDTT